MQVSICLSVYSWCLWPHNILVGGERVGFKYSLWKHVNWSPKCNWAGSYGAFQNRPSTHMSSACLLSVKKKKSQQITLIREMRRCRSKGKQLSRQNNSLAIRQSQRPLVPPPGLEIIFSDISSELSCRYWNPCQVGEVNCMLPTSTKTPDQLEPEGQWCWLQLTSTPTSQQKVLELTIYMAIFSSSFSYKISKQNMGSGELVLWDMSPPSPQDCLLPQ